MVDCPSCGVPIEKVRYYPSTGNYLHAKTENACGKVLKTSWVEEHKDEVEVVDAKEGETTEGGRGDFAPTRYHKLMMDVLRDPSYGLDENIITAVERHSYYYDGKLPLERLATLLKGREVPAKKAKAIVGEVNDALTTQLEEEPIFEEPLRGRRRESQLTEKVKRLEEKMEEPEDEASKIAKITEAKAWKKFSDLADQATPALNALQAFQKYGGLEMGALALAKKAGLEVPEEAKNDMAKRIVEQMRKSGEETEEGSEEPEPDRRAQEAFERAKKRMENKEGEDEEEEILEELP